MNNNDTDIKSLYIQHMHELVKVLTDVYDQLTSVSGFKDTMRSDIQMIRDLWLYTVTKCIQLGSMDEVKEESLVNSVVAQLDINNSVSVSNHIKSMKNDIKYQQYLQSAFGEGLDYPGLFWETLLSMSGTATVETEDATLYFIKQYAEFLKAIGEYLMLCEPNQRYKDLIQIYINDFFNQITNGENGLNIYPDTSLYNPLLENGGILPPTSQNAKAQSSFSARDSRTMNKETPNNFARKDMNNAIQTNDAGQVIWDTQYAKITYVGIKKEENFWGIEMLIENKRNSSLNLIYKNVTINGSALDGSFLFVYDLPAHRKTYAHASLRFDVTESLGIFGIEDIRDIGLILDCEEGLFDILTESPLIKLHAEKFSEKFNYKNMMGMKDIMLPESSYGRENNAVHIENEGDIIWNNEFVKLTYQGFHKELNFWSINIYLENKTNDEIYVFHGPIEMEGKIISSGEWQVGYLKPLKVQEDHISLMFDDMEDWGIQSLKDFRDLQLELCCKKQGEKIANSNQIIIHPKELNKSLGINKNGTSTVHDLASSVKHLYI